MQKEGGKDLGDEDEKCGGREGEKWACEKGGLRGMRESKKRGSERESA